MIPPRKHLLSLFSLCLLCFALAACGGDDKTSTSGEQGATEDHDEDHHAHSAPHGGVMMESSDHKAHFEVKHDVGAGLAILWLYDADMQAVTTKTAPVLNVEADDGPVQVKGACPEGKSEASEWHFSDEVLKGHVHAARFRVTVGGKTYTPDFPHDEHGDHEGHDHDGEGHDGHDHDGHDHAKEGPHHGLLAAFTGADGAAAGWVELKLHDDKGDLELWLATDDAMKTPFDLGVDAKIEITFVSRDDRKVTLHVRNREKNEDEDGVANVRDGKTNYFIFPGATGADATWLQGKDFEAEVRVSFTRDGATYTTKVFELSPHHH